MPWLPLPQVQPLPEFIFHIIAGTGLRVLFMTILTIPEFHTLETLVDSGYTHTHTRHGAQHSDSEISNQNL